MTDKEVYLILETTFQTEALITLSDNETVEEVKERLFDGGLKQYIKDYDPELGFSEPTNIKVLRVSNKVGD